jgi:transcriptional regulator with XRE-family HTH domain
MNTFAQSLQKLMDERKVKQKELADAIGLTQASISNYFVKGAEPGVDVIIKLAKYFNVGPEYFYPELATMHPVRKDRAEGKFTNDDLLDDYRVYNRHLINESENLWQEHKEMFGIIKGFIKNVG